MGPLWNTMLILPFSSCSIMLEPVTSEGIKSGVNCIREKGRLSAFPRERTSLVLPTPGTPSKSTLPPAIIAQITLSTVSSMPTISFASSSLSLAMDWLKRITFSGDSTLGASAGITLRTGSSYVSAAASGAVSSSASMPSATSPSTVSSVISASFCLFFLNLFILILNFRQTPLIFFVFLVPRGRTASEQGVEIRFKHLSL